MGTGLIESVRRVSSIFLGDVKSGVEKVLPSPVLHWPVQWPGQLLGKLVAGCFTWSASMIGGHAVFDVDCSGLHLDNSTRRLSLGRFGDNW
jgi:hypothetical protein